MACGTVQSFSNPLPISGINPRYIRPRFPETDTYDCRAAERGEETLFIKGMARAPFWEVNTIENGAE